jgi:B3 DNA binding domain
VKHIDIVKEAGSNTALLEGPTGRTWYVSIEKNTEGVFFTNGWSKFVQDHGLKEHEFLVFQYNGDVHFSLLIFDTTACEREDFGFCNGKLDVVYADGEREKKRKQHKGIDL